jgi:hypothetical protein
MVSGNIGDLNAMTNESENVSDLPLSQEIEPAEVSLEWDAEKAASGAVRSPRPWGPWATVGWTIMCLVALFGVQIAVEIIFAIVRLTAHPGVGPDDLSAIGAELSIDGNMLAAATLASTPAVVGLVTLLIWIKG